MSSNKVIATAVQEARQYPCMLCNQGCKVHIYIKNGRPYDQATGEPHDCPTKRIHYYFKGKWNEIQIKIVRDALEEIKKMPAVDLGKGIAMLESRLDFQEAWNKEWADKFNAWKDRD